MPMCLLGAPCLDFKEQALGVEDVVPEEPILHLVMLGLELGMVVFGGTHPPPLGKVTSWSSPLGLPLPGSSPQGVG